MDPHRQSGYASQAARRLNASTVILFTGTFFAAVLAARLCSSGEYWGAAAVTIAVLGVAVLAVVRISLEALLLAWFATMPLASFFIRFPTERSIITYNRVVIGIALIMLLAKWSAAAGISSASRSAARRDRPAVAAAISISKFELAWALLSLLALASALWQSYNVAYATRVAVDTFWLPLIAFHIARNHLDLRDRGKALVLGAIGLALFLFVTGAFELATGIDVLAYKGSEIVREGERRVNGPFASDNSYAIVCLLLFLFLWVAPRLSRVRLDRGARLVYWVALAGAAVGAMMPMFRAVGIALVAGGILLRVQARRSRPRTARRGLHARARLSPATIVILIVFIAGVVAIAPLLAGTRLTDPRSIYGRLATWKAAAEIAVENPIAGVGLGNYPEYYDRVRRERDEPIETVRETRASRYPHSNVLWIAAELGVTGLALYIAANLWMFMIGWRALKNASDRRRRMAAACFLTLTIAYHLPGLTLASGYFSDLNLCFFFLLGVLSGPVIEGRPGVAAPRSSRSA